MFVLTLLHNKNKQAAEHVILATGCPKVCPQIHLHHKSSKKN